MKRQRRAFRGRPAIFGHFRVEVNLPNQGSLWKVDFLLLNHGLSRHVRPGGPGGGEREGGRLRLVDWSGCRPHWRCPLRNIPRRPARHTYRPSTSLSHTEALAWSSGWLAGVGCSNRAQRRVSADIEHAIFALPQRPELRPLSTPPLHKHQKTLGTRDRPALETQIVR